MPATQIQQKRVAVPLSVGPMASAGDPAAIQDGQSPLLQNVFVRPNRFVARPPFTYDSLMNINGLANFDDATNKVARLIAMDTAHKIYEKGTSGETWSASLGTGSGTRITDYATFTWPNGQSRLYMMVDDGTGLPSQAVSFDGTNVSTAPFNSTIQSRCVTNFLNRLFFAYPRVTVTNAISTSGVTGAYDWTNVTNFVATSCSIKNIASGTATIGRVYVQANTGAKIEMVKRLAGLNSWIPITTSTTSTPIVWHQDARCVSGAQGMPVKFELIIVGPLWVANTSYNAGDCVIDANGALQRCTTAGAAGGAAPAWATTMGTTTTDNTVTWTLEQAASSTLGVTIGLLDNQTIPANNGSGAWSTFWTTGTVPPATNTLQVGQRITFGSSSTPTVVQAAVDFSYKDGLTDGDARKQNYGNQVTVGDFQYPFFNQESSLTATVDMQAIVWSEINSPKQILAVNTMGTPESAGFPTAAMATLSRYIVFKRNGFWTYQGTSDPNTPIQRENYVDGVGCLGPRALDNFEHDAYFIGQQDIYRLSTVGRFESTSLGKPMLPEPICGDMMREEIMNKAAAGWVESQSTYKRPLLAIDKSKLIVWVYTQKGILYAYDMRTSAWSKHPTPNNAEVDAMLYNPNTGNMYVAFASATYGLARMDYTQVANDTIDNTANTYAGTIAVVFKPVELGEEGQGQAPRMDATLERIEFHHAATTAQTMTAFYSFDQGKTFPKSAAITPTASVNGEYVKTSIPCWQSGPSITVKLQTTGKLGENGFVISPRAYAWCQVRRPEFIQTQPTQGSATL